MSGFSFRKGCTFGASSLEPLYNVMERKDPFFCWLLSPHTMCWTVGVIYQSVKQHYALA